MKLNKRLNSFLQKRHWLTWHNHSTLLNYGHMLFCVREMFNPAIHLSDAEARVQYGKDVVSRQLSGEALSVCAGAEQFQH